MSTPGVESRVVEVGRSLGRIVENLKRIGYLFDRPGKALPGPAPDAAAAISRIEKEAGVLPLALKLFWTRVGSVDLSGRHEEWHGCEYPDPLIVYPPAMAIEELEEFLEDREERIRSDYPYLVPIAPDTFHKANVSGGMWYNVDVPAVADDPPLNDERHETTFMRYLEIAVAFGGFPGLETSTHHSWPLAAIVQDTPV